MPARPTPEDHRSYQSVTYLNALVSADENWSDHAGRRPETDAERAEVERWALGYIADGMVDVYDGDDLDRIAGHARNAAAQPSAVSQ